MLRLLTLFVCILSSLVESSLASENEQQPNILFIFSDDHAYQAVGAYGSKVNKTPNIDRIARDGMRFDRCYVTNSICGPSRAVILTGKYSHKNGFYSNRTPRFDGSQTTFPKLLQHAGYQTAIIGKWHLVSDPTGFDHWDILPGQGRYYSPVFISEKGREVAPGYATDVTTDKALAWLEEDRDASQPFLLMVQHKAPHREWAPSPTHLNSFADRGIPEPETLFDDYSHRSSAAQDATMRIADHMSLDSDLKVFGPENQYGKRLFRLMSPEQQAAWKAAFDADNLAFLQSKLQGKELTRWKYQRYMRQYLSCVQSVDDSVGRLLDYLDKNGLADNTIVVYASDQGFYLGEHGWYDKRWMYEESLRTPFVVRWPGKVKPGSVENHIVSNVDFAETFLDAAGVDVPDDMQGRSLVPILSGNPPEDWRDTFYYHYYEGPPAVHTVAEHYGVTNGRHKLIHFHKLGEWELFDLKEDPNEMHSVYEEPEYAQVVQDMKKELARLRGELEVVTDEEPPLPQPESAG
jgi:arylsulfatase A-like enzyme